MIETSDIRSLLLQEKSVVETSLPAMMLGLMAEKCLEAGFEFRSDILKRLNVAAVAPLSGLGNDLSVSRVAKRLDDASRALLNDMSPDSPQHGLYVCAMLILLLVDGQFFADAKNMAVLVALLLMNELRDRGSDSAYVFNEVLLRSEASKTLGRAQLLGLYNVPMKLMTPDASMLQRA